MQRLAMQSIQAQWPQLLQADLKADVFLQQTSTSNYRILNHHLHYIGIYKSAALGLYTGG
jgi:hypothetical protein